MKNVVHFLPFLLILVLAAACGLSDEQIAQTAEVINATLAAESTGTAVIQSTTDAVETALAETAAVATETQLAAEEKATRQANAQETLLAKTQEGYARATEAVSEIRPIVDALYDAGHITTRDGYHQELNTWEYNWAQMNWYTIFPTKGDSEATDFVLLMDLSWESASKYNELDVAGCGFAFRADETYGSYYAFLLTLDGYLSFLSKTPQKYSVLSKAYWGKLDYAEGSTTIILVAQGNTFQVFNTDLERIDLRYGSALTEGSIAYILSSGSNDGFGTRCQFTDVDLWHLPSE
jgi:hypothetical protein